MPDSEQAFYEGMIRRITWIILVLGLAGAVILGMAKGIRVGGGFLMGAAVSYLSFWRWQQVVNALGPVPKYRSPMWLVLRFMVLAAAAYGIIKFTGVNLTAALIGLLVAAAAVTIEI